MQRFFSLFIFILLFFNLSLLEAQELARKGTLGLQMRPLSGIMAEQLGMISSMNGVLIIKVLPNSTADFLDLKTDDVLLSINGESVHTPVEVDNYIQPLKAGEEISIRFFRAGEIQERTGKLQGKKKEQSDFANVLYEQVPYESEFLRCIIHQPKRGRVFPAIFFIQGYSCESIDYHDQPQHPTRQLIDGWVQNGFVVFRVEKARVGDSLGEKDCVDMSFLEEQAVFEAAYSHLRQYDFVDTTNIFLFGHGLGGVIAPLLTKKYMPKGIAVYGTIATSWFEYLLKTYRQQVVLLQKDYQAAEGMLKSYMPLLYNYLIAGKTPDELLQNPAYAKILHQPAIGYKDNRFFGRHYRFWQELQNQDLTNFWSNVNCSVLTLFGEYDVQAIDLMSAQRIADMVNVVTRDKARYVLIPQTEHDFVKLPNWKTYLQLRATDEWTATYKAAHFNEELVRVTAEWMLECLNSEK